MERYILADYGTRFHKKLCKQWKDIEDDNEERELKEDVSADDIIEFTESYIEELIEAVKNSIYVELHECQDKLQKRMNKMQDGI